MCIMHFSKKIKKKPFFLINDDSTYRIVIQTIDNNTHSQLDTWKTSQES